MSKRSTTLSGLRSVLELSAMANVYRKVSAAILSAFLICGYYQSQAQLLPACGTTYMVERAMAENPALRSKLEALEKETKAFEKHWLEHHQGSKSAQNDPVLIIPTVVHVMHSNGGDNISKAQVDDAIRIMNEDFARLNSDTAQLTAPFKGIAGNTKIEFRLATLDPNGNCTDGVTRTFTPLTNNADENVKQLISWPTERYFNIWVVSRISFGAGGYAYYPGTAPTQQQEGVVVLNTQFGSIGLSGRSNFAARTMTHEAGHYFNLPHTWGSSNTPGNPSNCNIDDGVQDTPNTVGVSNQSCPLSMMSCGNLSNVENYMDYSTCGRMFTEGQSVRMRAAANSNMGLRSSLWQASNLITTGTADPYQPPLCPPTAYFVPGIKFSCSNTLVTVTGNIQNAPEDTTVRFKWYSPTAVPDTAVGKSARLFYPTPGLKDVYLIISNASGTDTAFIQAAFEIKDGTPGFVSPYSEGFETAGFPATGNPQTEWSFEQTVPQNGWMQTNMAANTGSSSVYVPLYLRQRNSSIALLSPRIDISSLQRPSFLAFSHAFASRVDTGNNSLTVSISTNCGASWQRIYSRSRSSVPRLVTNTGGSAVTSAFIPQSVAEWRANYVNLDRFLSSGVVQFKFEVFNQDGDGLYIDNVNVGSNLVTGVETTLSNQIIIYPNPSRDRITLDVPDELIGKQIQLNTSLGKSCIKATIENSSYTMTHNLPAGVYYLSVDGKYIRSVIVE